MVTQSTTRTTRGFYSFVIYQCNASKILIRYYMYLILKKSEGIKIRVELGRAEVPAYGQVLLN